MVRYQRDFLVVKDSGLGEFREFPDRGRRGNVIPENEVQLGLDKFSGTNDLFAGMGRKDLLSHGHWLLGLSRHE
jgi:hypothetical protein